MYTPPDDLNPYLAVPCCADSDLKEYLTKKNYHPELINAIAHGVAIAAEYKKWHHDHIVKPTLSEPIFKEVKD